MTQPKAEVPQFIGVRIKRREDPALITGQGKYVADIQPEGALHMKVVRSPYGHARIRGIDAREAQEMPGVVAVLTGAEINAQLRKALPSARAAGDAFSVARNPERFPLATGKVRCVGDPVAVVVAETAALAADAVDMVYVDYEPLPAVVTAEEAMKVGAPAVHDEWEDNVAFRWSRSGGEVDEAFASAAVTVTLRLENQRVIGNPMEPRAVVAQYDAAGEQLTAWTTTQVPHAVRDHLAETLDMAKEQVRVIAPEVGGGFGVKANRYGEEVLVPFLARHLGRPVKWVATRSEDFVATHHGRGQIDIVKLAADGEGRVAAVDLEMILNCGAYYSVVAPVIPSITASMMTGVYAIPHVRATAVGVFTNTHPVDPYRGAGRPEAAYLIERGMDALAQKLGMEPTELRRRNFIAPEAFPYESPTGLTYDSGTYAAALDKALALADYEGLRKEQAKRRKQGGRLMGIGVACYVEICGFGPWESGGVSMDGEGKVTVATGASAQGQGHRTTFAQIAADVLRVRPEEITVKQGDTAAVARGIGTFGSRSTVVAGSAVRQNSEKVREKGKLIAAHLLEAAVEDVVMEDGRFMVRGAPQFSLSWKEIARAANRAAGGDGAALPEELGGGLGSDEDFETNKTTYPFGAHVCVVEIDAESGEIEIRRYVAVDDCGRAINPMLVEGQVHGGIAQGIGQALFERAAYDGMGNLVTGSFMDYGLPRADDLPKFETSRTETLSPVNPLGAKGIGEAATIGSTPAVVSAVVDGLAHLGVEHVDMPLTAERIWRVLQERGV